ncbi:histidine phosphatase family protein [Peribacillus deserti]|uniref:Histidine phosphatase family protein n=1 Tax=Peribacillus deserti TaxID=673318 RepID=A0A2N5M7Z1_9BACI|nr:histidine phosphatase family protein [Peribacillus deserti]PLT30467.1 histidine phosphatase family protein [Peribacillus deserti]
MTVLYVVRHAHSHYNPDELGRPLSAKGTKDAKTVCQMLKNEKIDRIFSSPYRRAVETVETLSALVKKDIIIEDALRERTLSDVPLENFAFAIEKVWENSSFKWEGGESNNEAQQRGVKAIFNLLHTYEGEKMVISTHGNIMVLIMNYFNPLYHFKFWKQLDMPDIYKLSFDGVTHVDVERMWRRA